jgi:nucleoside-diphosphate-sugar epimerase
VDTILVTGASGAIGPHLLAALTRELPAARFGVLLRPGRATTEERISRLRQRVAELCEYDSVAACELHERLLPVTGDIRQPQCAIAPALAARLASDSTCIVHAAADTRFQADPAEQWATNVEATRQVLDWARGCRKLQRLVLVSTTCVAGTPPRGVASAGRGPGSRRRTGECS